MSKFSSDEYCLLKLTPSLTPGLKRIIKIDPKIVTKDKNNEINRNETTISRLFSPLLVAVMP